MSIDIIKFFIIFKKEKIWKNILNYSLISGIFLDRVWLIEKGEIMMNKRNVIIIIVLSVILAALIGTAFMVNKYIKDKETVETFARTNYNQSYIYIIKERKESLISWLTLVT